MAGCVETGWLRGGAGGGGAREEVEVEVEDKGGLLFSICTALLLIYIAEDDSSARFLPRGVCY